MIALATENFISLQNFRNYSVLPLSFVRHYVAHVAHCALAGGLYRGEIWKVNLLFGQVVLHNDLLVQKTRR